MEKELFSYEYKVLVARHVTTYYQCRLKKSIGLLKKDSLVAEIDIHFEKGEMILSDDDGTVICQVELVLDARGII